MNAFVTPDQNSMTELPKIIDPRTKRREPFFSAQDSANPSIPPQAELVDQNGHRFSITRIPYLMGRSGDCDLVLSGRGVSRSHAEIEWLDGNYHIRDLRSLNGTRVNGLTITRVVLKNGDRVEVGQTTLVFSVIQSEIFPVYATQQRITEAIEPRQRPKKQSEPKQAATKTSSNSKLTFLMWFNFALIAV
ncbi:MAG: FHA domain-containing protein, partial [Pseudomonadota bacterium]